MCGISVRRPLQRLNSGEGSGEADAEAARRASVATRMAATKRSGGMALIMRWRAIRQTSQG